MYLLDSDWPYAIEGNLVSGTAVQKKMSRAAELIIEWNLLLTPNEPQKNRINRPGRLSYN
jgi:hypothetical protein